ncbi:MAG TPA: DUF2723 domain-containing protein [Rubrobacteraceae bacterium]|nr:DUF2723 domain-containing protein [Rubrobacteraceae bacterium]
MKDSRKESDSSLRSVAFVALFGLAAAVFVFVVYVRTLAPTVLYYDRPILLDSVMLQAQATVLGITGPTGEPTWVMLTHLFTKLPFGDPAYRVNLASAVYASITVFLVFVAGYLLSRRVAAAFAAALAFGLGGTFWSQAVIAEIYTMNTLLIMLPIITLILWRERRERPRSDRYLLLACFLMGFALTNHLTSGLVLPASFLFVAAVDWRKLLDWRLALKGAGLFVIGLLPYLYLPIRSSMNPPMNEADPSNFARFYEFVTGSDLNGVFGKFGPIELIGRVIMYGQNLFADFHWGLVMVGIVGFMAMLVRDKAMAVLIGFLYFGWLAHALEFGIFDTKLYFIPTYLMLSLAMAVGFGFLVRAVEDVFENRRRAVAGAGIAVVSALIALYPLVGIGQKYEQYDMSDDYKGQEILDAVIHKAKHGGTVLHHRSGLWYMVLVEKKRPDLRIIDPWYPSWKRETDIVWPDDIDLVTTNLRYGTNDYTGVATAKEAAKRGPVYILDQDSAGPHNFIEAGFKIVRVEKGLLYELVPPGGKQYTSEKESES